jgi:hypothetical protein
MLNPYDWIRRCQSGSELLAILHLLEHPPEDDEIELDWYTEDAPAGPAGAVQSSCFRCRVCPRPPHAEYCHTCHTIAEYGKRYTKYIRRISVVWGYMTQIPPLGGKEILGRYIVDDYRFLLLLSRQTLKSWLQQFVLQTNPDLHGLLQIFPTIGSGGNIGMGDVLCRASHHEANMPMNQLWVRFFSAPYQLVNPKQRNEEGILSFELGEFLRLMDMAEIFCTVLTYEQQRNLHDLFKVNVQAEQAFHWGRFARQLDQRARDMLTGWNIRQWPENKIKLLYELVDYVFPAKFD